MKKFISTDRNFYRVVFSIALPIILQNVITNFVNMLDNIMVGQLGTLEMSAVSICNQILMIFHLAVFGSVTAAGIFGAQYEGKKDYDGVRHCLRAKFYLTGILTILAIFILLKWGNQLALLYMDESTNTQSDILYASSQAVTYLKIMCIGLIPFALAQSLSSTIRESGNTVLPMFASSAAVAINFVGNALLIFGLFGLPAMGVQGAALATVISRFAELLILAFGAILNRASMPYLNGLLHSFYIPKDLTKNILTRGTPILLNEICWSFGIAAISQCYSVRGLDAVAAFNIANTIENLFITVAIGMGSAIGIIVGQKLGAGLSEEAVEWDRQMIFLSIVLCTVVGIIMYFLAPLFPQFYQTSDHVRQLAVTLLKIVAIFIPVAGIVNTCYFTLRSGGKTILTFLFDAFSTLVITFPIIYVLSRFTQMTVIEMFIVYHIIDLIKGIIGLFLVHSRIWVNNLTV